VVGGRFDVRLRQSAAASCMVAWFMKAVSAPGHLKKKKKKQNKKHHKKKKKKKKTKTAARHLP